MDPASVIETDRLRLVDVDPDVHAAAINALVVESFDSLHPYMLFAEKLPSVEDTREAFRMMRESRKDGHFCNFAIFSKELDRLVGVTAIAKLRGPVGDRIREQIDSSEYKNPWIIGYWLGKNYEGRGYMTEANKALLKFGVESFGVDCYLVDISPKNQKSANVVKRLGFEFLTDSFMINKALYAHPERYAMRKCRK